MCVADGGGEQTDKPLDQAAKFLAKLLQYAPQDPEVHVLAAELYARRNKPLLVLREVRLRARTCKAVICFVLMREW